MRSALRIGPPITNHLEQRVLFEGHKLHGSHPPLRQLQAKYLRGLALIKELSTVPLAIFV